MGEGGAVGEGAALLPSQSRLGETISERQLRLRHEQAARAKREAALPATSPATLPASPPASPPTTLPVASPAVDGVANSEAAATMMVEAERVWRRGDDGAETMAAAAVFIKAAQDAKVQSRPPPNL